MNRSLRFAWVIVVFLWLPPPRSPAAEAEEIVVADLMPPSGTTGRTNIADKLTLGTRMTYFILLDSTSDSFLGSIGTLDECQDYIPWKLYATWQFNPKWGLELTWDQVKATAITHTADQHTDGKFEVMGPILSAEYRLDKFGRFSPYAQFGLAWMLGDFDPAQWWALGYATEADWVLLGSTDQVRNGITREIDDDDSLGLVAAVGTRIEFSERWSGDLLLRYMYLESDATFTEYRKGRPIPGTGDSNTIPFSNLALGVGVAYAF
jgi:outer membrane protein W